jgi:cystathionine gamma-lyase
MSRGFATRAIHCGNEPDSKFGGVAPAIDLSTTFAQPYPGQPVCFDYARCGNPTRLALERNLAALENAKYAFALNSGCSALLTIMNLLQQGDHCLCIDDVYGGTQRYMRRILSERQGVQLDFVDFSDLSVVRKAMKASTKVVWAETPTNPTLKICDIAAIAKICKERGALLVVDNTFFTPYLQNPLDLGADMVVHSITKYIGGHSDVVMGAIMLNDKALYDRLFFTMKSIGSGASPFDCYLALRGSKTLHVRVERAMQNAQLIANYLEKHPKVTRVIYPGLKSHPQHDLCKKQARGPGAMISFYIKGDIKTAERFLRAVKIFTLAESLGGVESLIENPALMTHFSVPPEQRKLLGIEDNFIRISCGIEDGKDLLEDVKQALEKA